MTAENGTLRVMYLAGPGDVTNTFRLWLDGKPDPTQLGRTYSGQFFDAVSAVGARALVISSHPRPDAEAARNIEVIHQAIPSLSHGGLRFHIGQVRYALGMVRRARAWRADLLLVSGQTHWFAYSVAGMLGIRVVPCVHSAFWPRGHPPRRLAYLALLWINGRFWRRWPWATIVVSEECARQINRVAGRVRSPMFSVRAQYRVESFRYRPADPIGDGPFRLLYAGRVEREKGVFDLLEMMRLLNRDHPGRFTLEVCGEGSHLEELSQRVQAEQFADSVRLRGRLDGPELLEALVASHVVVVPTTSGWSEGLNKVVVEGVLSGRPVVTSEVSHAGDELGEALLLVPPDDPEAYAQAVSRLAAEPVLFQNKCAACDRLRAVFFDPTRGFGGAVETLCRQLIAERMPSNTVAAPAFSHEAAHPPALSATVKVARQAVRIAVIQHGDYLGARGLVDAGKPEAEFGIGYSIACLESLFDQRPHLVLSLDAPAYEVQLGPARLAGLPPQPRSAAMPQTATMMALARTIRRQLEEFNPTHVLLRTGIAPIADAVLSFSARRRLSSLVILAENMTRGGPSHPMGNWYQRRVVRRLNHPSVFLVGNYRSPGARSLVDCGVLPHKAVAWDWPGIRRPEDFPVKKRTDGGTARITFVGSVTEARGVGDLVRAIGLMRRAGRDVVATILGDGADLARFRVLAEELSGRATLFMGAVPHTTAFAVMLDSDLVVIPSRHEQAESIPLSLTDALASRTPVVASDHPSFSATFKEGQGVRFFPAGDAAALAATMESVLGDPALYQRISAGTAQAFGEVECPTSFGELLENWKASF